MTDTAILTALALSCTLTPSPAESSTQLMADQVLAALGNLATFPKSTPYPPA